MAVGVLRLMRGRDPASIDRESDAADEAGVVRGHEDDRRVRPVTGRALLPKWVVQLTMRGKNWVVKPKIC